jgi:hypothetical protein
MDYQERSRDRMRRRKRNIRNRKIAFGIILVTIIGLMVWIFIPKDIEEREEQVSGALAPMNVPSPTLQITKDVLIATPTPEPIPTKELEPTYTEDDLFCMAAAIYNEAGGDMCSDETRLLVGYVILNRVNSPGFPNTIREVLEAKGQYGKFYWTGVKFADRSSKPEEQHAVERAYEIAKRVLSEPSTIPETVVFQAEFEQGTGVYKYQDGIYFCHAKEVN